MVDTDVGFRLSTYLKDISCHLIFSTGRIITFQDVSYSDEVICKFESNVMVHDFWARGVGSMPVIRNGIGTLRVDYRLSFTGHDAEDYESFEMVVPLIKRETVYDRSARKRAQ